MLKYSIPFRGRLPYDPFESHLAKQLARVGILSNDISTLYSNVDSIYGFVGPTPLNGGRSNFGVEIEMRDIEIALNNHIKVRVPLSTTLPTLEAYNHPSSKEVFKFLQDTGGGIVVASDILADWIRNDYDNISIEASAIQNLDTLNDIEDKLKKYHTICLPVKMSKGYNNTLKDISDKSRVRLFATNECSYNCPKWSCYSMISKMSSNNLLKHDGDINKMKEERENYFCSMGILNRDGSQKYPRDPWWNDGFLFNIDKLYSLGFNRFKIANSV